MSLFGAIRSLPAILLYKRSNQKQEIDQDIKRFGARNLSEAMVKSKIFRSIFYSRLKSNSRWLLKVSKLFMRQKIELLIDCESTIGGGMMVYHGDSSVIYAKSIGRRFTVYQQVTVGRGKMIDGNDLPMIGNDVTVYAGAIIIGGVTIGDHAIIGAGAVVSKDVPPYTTVVSAPVRMITQKRIKDE